MKKYIYLTCALLLGAFASCSQSETGDETSPTHQVTLQVTADGGIQTRGEVIVADRFAIEVYTDATYTTPANVFTGETNKASNTTGLFSMVLDRTQEYYCLLWADKAGTSVYNLTSLKAVTLTGKAAEAWHGTKVIEAGTTANPSIELKRAVSKISLMQTGKIKAGTLTLNFNQPTVFNVTNATTSVETARPAETITIASDVDGTSTPVKLNTADIFVLSPVDIANLTDLTFKYGTEDEFTVSQAPLKANFNTNIKGNYTTKSIPTFTVTCEDEWGATDNDEELPSSAADFIVVNGIKVAEGNLVANGANGAKIGLPTDTSLYFQFGSLIGWSATGDPTIVVRPANFNGNEDWYDTGRIWQGTTGVVPFAEAGSDNEKAGIGDPCRYYLKGTWRLPTNGEFTALFNTTNSSYKNGWSWDDTSASASHLSGLKLQALGFRSSDVGDPNLVGANGLYWASSSYNSGQGFYMNFYSSGVNPSTNSIRTNGLAIRCVRD